MLVRLEHTADVQAIGDLISAAFETAPHSSGTEAAIVDALRTAGALTLSLVAMEGDAIVGHVAFSPVTIDGKVAGWFGLGPVSVRPDRQNKGIGTNLIGDGLDRLAEMGAAGCVVLGDPAYYGRFGFEGELGLRYGDVPPEYFQCLIFSSDKPQGEVAYHPGFGP